MLLGGVSVSASEEPEVPITAEKIDASSELVVIRGTILSSWGSRRFGSIWCHYSLISSEEILIYCSMQCRGGLEEQEITC